MILRTRLNLEKIQVCETQCTLVRLSVFGALDRATATGRGGITREYARESIAKKGESIKNGERGGVHQAWVCAHTAITAPESIQTLLPNE